MTWSICREWRKSWRLFNSSWYLEWGCDVSNHYPLTKMGAITRAYMATKPSATGMVSRHIPQQQALPLGQQQCVLQHTTYVEQPHGFQGSLSSDTTSSQNESCSEKSIRKKSWEFSLSMLSVLKKCATKFCKFRYTNFYSEIRNDPKLLNIG